eukprot:SM000030S11315  [mRNA]  locus=s30:94061:94620:+ [translate_table: standard]
MQWSTVVVCHARCISCILALALPENFPTLFVADPNRPGMSKKLLSFLAHSGSPRIVYVSCNPATCSRDLAILCHGTEEGPRHEGPYQLLSVQPVDMFPHTPHVECVCSLQLRELSGDVGTLYLA